jgi:hypothetical protein
MSVNMLKGIHRRVLGISKDDQVMGARGFVSGGDRKPAIVHSAPDTVALFDDFLGDIVADEWNPVEGDTGHTQGITAGTNGVYRLTNSATAGTTVAAVNQVTSALNWKVNQGKGAHAGRLRMGARIKAANYTFGGLFVGFTDVVTAEMPVYDTGGALFTQAADCVGFLIGENGDTGWVGVSAKSTAGDSGDQSVALGVTPTANKYTTLEVEINRGRSDTGSVATFYVDGLPRKRIVSPVASTVAMTPTVAVFDVDAAGAPVVDIDYINVSAPRDTGL